jgi:peptidoglycan/xylan/chitin deacetylase (PgdA/CDA1 family)
VGTDQTVLKNVSVLTETFKKQMLFIRRIFNPVNIDQVNKFYSNTNYQLPNYPILVTFDGGYRGFYENAFQVLKNYNIPALLYIVTQSIDDDEIPWPTKLSYIIENTKMHNLTFEYNNFEIFNGALANKKVVIGEIKRKLYSTNSRDRESIINKLAELLHIDILKTKGLFLTWNDICHILKSELVDIGSHTISHPRLSDIDLTNAIDEIKTSKMLIEKNTGINITSFCYPDGKVNDSIIQIVRDSKYLTGTTTLNGFNTVHTDPFQLRRIGGENIPNFMFAMKITSLPNKFKLWLHQRIKNKNS